MPQNDVDDSDDDAIAINTIAFWRYFYDCYYPQLLRRAAALPDIRSGTKIRKTL